MRKFVYYQVLEKFSQLDPSNIELAYKQKEKDINGKHKYVSLADNGNLTIHNIITKGYWDQKKCDLDYKDSKKIIIGDPMTNETLYVRFI